MTRETGLEHLTLLSVPPPDLVAVAAAAGFGSVGLRISPATDDERPWPVSPGSPMLAETVRRCSDTGITVLDVEAIRLGSQSPDWSPVLEAAAALGARFVNAICDDRDLSRLSAEFAALFGSAEPNAEGTAAALKALGQTGKVLNVGFDASPTEVSLLKEGEINAVVAQPAAEEGADAAQFAYDKITGNPSGITASVQLPDVLITSADASQASYAKYFYIS